jgi:Protein of unknown function (DUF1592)/Protein of unknown function (DUF1588)/Protein of unknown function (DUF1585)/Protein of unknown function (DUF1587)/Protein of unknown function (DUF1595)
MVGTAIQFILIALLAIGLSHQLSANDLSAIQQIVSNSCINCHSGTEPAGQFSLDKLSLDRESFQRDDFDVVPWERMLRKVRAGQMPPPGEEVDSQLVVKAKEEMDELLDQRADKFPFAPSNSLRRLTRTEYQNSVRDLLDLQIDATVLLPKDESSHGFDNVTVSELSPAFIGRAVTAAQQISRTALGIAAVGPSGVTVRVPANRTQESHVEGLPLGTRGGTLIQHHFPQSGVYEFQIRLARDRDEKIEGLSQPAEMDILLDKQPVHRFQIDKPSRPQDHTLVDAHLKTRITIPAGPHAVGVTFPQTSDSLLEYRKQPFQAAYNHHRHPRIHPAIFEVTIVGPVENIDNSIPDTPVTRRLLNGLPRNPNLEEQDHVAHLVLSRLARLAYRRPIDSEDQQAFTRYYDSAKHNGFAAGLELAMASILVNPNFLMRVEQTASDTTSFSNSQNSAQSKPETVRISDIDLASRLSFFLWSSLPDEALLELAESNQLSQPSVLSGEVQRMLQDRRAESLVSNFANQWLYLRNLDSLTPDLRLYTDFDDNLRQAMRQETECLIREVINEDLSVLQLLQSDHTFLNQRLAAHYEIPGVLGSQMRRVELSPAHRRGGILRHASILSITSYATRTSPTIRGSWILENIIGTPPPPPPPNVPALKESLDTKSLTTRQRLKIHRENEACASCHNLMDPVGFALENYDALGRWRNFEQDLPIDSSGALPDGAEAANVEEIERNLLLRPELFVGTMTEKLVTFALGRGIEPEDGPYIRRVVRQAASSDFRFSSIVESIVHSPIFQTRSRQ